MIRRAVPIIIVVLLALGMIYLPGWDQGAEKVPPNTMPKVRAGGLPPGHPPIDASGATRSASDAAAEEAGETDTQSLPLKATGLGSEAELARVLSAISNTEDRAAFEEGFRLCFTTSTGRRDFPRAKTLFRKVLARDPNMAAAYRGLAYAELNTTFDFPATISFYEKAVELEPDYGEAHYALAFMLGGSDPKRAETHFRRALALGIADEQNLKTRFFSGVD